MTEPAKRRVWLDADPGFDDWLAMLMLAANPNVEWIGMSVVAGNAPLRHTLANALAIRHFHGLQMPVFAGADKALNVRPSDLPRITAQNILGESGMRTEGQPLPPSADPPNGADAVAAMLAAIHASPAPVTVVALGPMTNIARALLLDPSVTERISEIVFMGGSTDRGNHTPAAEFNVFADPEAADGVMKSGVALRMFGLNLCRQVLVTQKHVRAMQIWPGPQAKVLAGYLDAYQRIRSEDGTSPMPLYDPVVTAWLAAPELFEFVAAQVDVERFGEFTRGMTVCNFKSMAQAKPNVQVAMAAQGEQVIDFILETLKAALHNPAPG